MFSSRPKFLYTFVVDEIRNVPKHSGSCYVQWRIHNTLPALKGRTPTTHIKDFRAVWRHTEEGVLKVGTKDNELQPRWLELEVFIVTKSHAQHDQGRTERQKSFLGKIMINLSEFAGVDGTQPMRYLLKDSRVNAVISVSIGMSLIKGNLNDYIIPKLSSKGLANALDESTFESVSNSSKHGGASASSPMSDQKFHRSLKFASDPVITRLYQRTFEISWDPRPGEYTAEECVDDIILGSDGWAKNEDGVNIIDLQLDRYKKQDASNLKQADKLKEIDIRPDLKSWNVQHLIN